MNPDDVALVALQRQDYKTALKLLRPLARKGNAIAQHDMGVMSVTGRGLPLDLDAAQAFFRMASSQRYIPSLYSLGLMYAQAEGQPPDPVEAYKWLALARQQLGIEADTKVVAEFSPKVHAAIAKMEEVLKPEDVSKAKQRASAWNPENWRHEANKQRLQQIRSVQDYNDACQRYGHLQKGTRGADDLIRAEMTEGRYDLMTCIAFVECSCMMKDCGEREPVISEVLFYTKALGSMAKDLPKFDAQALVASALVVRDYCKPNRSSNPGADAAFAKLRATYSKAYPTRR